MNSRSWRTDELGHLIRHALHETVGDASPSPESWPVIRRGVIDQGPSRGPGLWILLTSPGFQASLVLVLVLALVSTLSWDGTTPDDALAGEQGTFEATSVLSEAIVIDHPSEPSPIIMRAKEAAARRALSTAVGRGEFEGTLSISSSQPAKPQAQAPVPRIGLARARD